MFAVGDKVWLVEGRGCIAVSSERGYGSIRATIGRSRWDLGNLAAQRAAAVRGSWLLSLAPRWAGRYLGYLLSRHDCTSV